MFQRELDKYYASCHSLLWITAKWITNKVYMLLYWCILKELTHTTELHVLFIIILCTNVTRICRICDYMHTIIATTTIYNILQKHTSDLYWQIERCKTVLVYLPCIRSCYSIIKCYIFLHNWVYGKYPWVLSLLTIK